MCVLLGVICHTISFYNGNKLNGIQENASNDD